MPDSSLSEVNEEASTVPKVLNHLIEKPDTISDIDFLKEDIYSSPKFMYDPSKYSYFIAFLTLLWAETAEERMRIRFVDADNKEPLNRSLCGNKYIFNNFKVQMLQAAQKNLEAKTLQQKKKIGSKLVALRK